MKDDERRAAAAANLAKRKQTLREGRTARRRRTAKLILVASGAVLVIVLISVILGMAGERHEAESGTSAENAAEEITPDIVIGLKGSAVQMVLQGDPYIENGAFAIDRNSGAIPEADIVIEGDVDTSAPGEYEVTYTAGSGEYAKTASRTVRVLSEDEFGNKAGNVPVMMYHWVYIADDVPEELDGNWILDTTLDEQMTFLEDEGYYYPGWKELRAWVDDEISIPAKCVVITFDDGKEAFLKYGIPVLEKHKIPATSFMIGWKKNKGAKKIRKYASEYIDFESHTYAMHQKTDDPYHKGIFNTMSNEEIAADLSKASKLLGNNDAIAYPYGDYTDEFISAVRDQGILLGFTVEYDRVRKGMDPYKLPRVRVLGDESFQIWKESVW